MQEQRRFDQFEFHDVELARRIADHVDARVNRRCGALPPVPRRKRLRRFARVP
jgi:hypothetical protein